MGPGLGGQRGSAVAGPHLVRGLPNMHVGLQEVYEVGRRCAERRRRIAGDSMRGIENVEGQCGGWPIRNLLGPGAEPARRIAHGHHSSITRQSISIDRVPHLRPHRPPEALQCPRSVLMLRAGFFGDHDEAAGAVAQAHG